MVIIILIISLYTIIIAGTMYLGCFIDDSSNRTLPNFPLIHFGMTRAYCAEYCAYKNQRYAGIQFSYKCFCGDSDADYNKYGQVDESECNMSCSGNASEVCGGVRRQKVFLGKGLKIFLRN